MDSVLLGVILIVVGLIAGGLSYMALRDNKGKDPLMDRLAQFGVDEVPDSLEKIELSLSFQDRIMIPALRWLGGILERFTPQKQLDQTRKMIDQAGMSTDPSTFFAMRVVLTVVFFVAGVFLFVITGIRPLGANPIISVALITFLGNYMPVNSLKSRISKRQKNVIRALPDALDLLVICVEAGLGFDQAMGRIYEKWDNDLALAFGRVLKEIQLGKRRSDSLRDMADRLDVPDVNAFAAAIIQADQLGVSMAKILRVQSDQMRVKRRQRAQEKAQQAPIKMMIPMVLLIFPSIWIVLLGPAIIQVMNMSGTGLF
jgi:tight adherence protein C